MECSRNNFCFFVGLAPLTEMEKWESVETMETSYDKKEELIREMARELFQDLIVSQPSYRTIHPLFYSCH